MKITIARARELAVHLFELEAESIGNDPAGHFEANDWFHKYGDDSVKFEEKLTSDRKNQHNAKFIEKIAAALKLDFATGFWTPTEEDVKNDSLYQVDMPEEYGGWICKALEIQLAVLTGVGFQTELEFN